MIVGILTQNGYTNGKDYTIRYYKSSPFRANRGEKNIQECWIKAHNTPSSVAVCEDDFDDIESLTDYVCGLVDMDWFSKKKNKSTHYAVGDLISYKGIEESVFQIVGIKGSNYIVVEIGDRTRTKNTIPFADNAKLQKAVSPLLIAEAKLALDADNTTLKGIFDKNDLQTLQKTDTDSIYRAKHYFSGRHILSNNRFSRSYYIYDIAQLDLFKLLIEKRNVFILRPVEMIDGKYYCPKSNVFDVVVDPCEFDTCFVHINQSNILLTEAKLAKKQSKFQIGDYVCIDGDLAHIRKVERIREKKNGNGFEYLLENTLSETDYIDEKYLSKVKISLISGTSENLIQDFQDNIWKNGFNSVTLRQLDNLIKDIQDGRIETDTDRRLRQSSIRFARINDGRMVGENYQSRSESIPLIAAQICAGSCGRINKSASGYFIEGLIEKWAKHANCWIDDIEKYALSKSWERAKELDGTESMLYTTPYNTIVKVWGMNNYYFNPQLAVEKITLHNFLFGSDTYLNVIGFTKINYFLYFILEQPIIHFTKESFNSIAIQDYLQKKYPNCNVDKFKGQFIVHLPDIYIWDLHGRNVVRTSKNRDFVVIDCNIKFQNDDNIKDLNSDLSGTSTPPKITDKGDDFSYFDYPKDIIDKFYTYIRISNLDKHIPAYSNYFFDEDGHLCFPTRRTQDIIDCVDIDRCLKEYEVLKNEWIATAENNIDGFIWLYFINDTELSPRGSYDYKLFNRDLVELLLGYANKFEETSELYPDKLGVENLQDYNKTKEILTKRLAELDKQEKKPKQTKKPQTIPTIQPERLLTCYQDIGTAKLMVAEQKSGEKITYCITEMRI